MTDPILDHPLLTARYFYPYPNHFDTPFIVQGEGFSLGCRYLRLSDKFPTIIHFHGNGETVSDYLGDFEQIITGMKVNLLLAEYRGYGMSDGEPGLAAMLDDVKLIVEASGVPPKRIIFFGRSLGSLYAVHGAYLKTQLQLTPRYNIAPTQSVPVVREVVKGERSLDDLSWGLVPSWAKDPLIGSKMINARSETVHEKPSFRHALRQRRCIVPASGFFEWSHTDGSKQPWYIKLKDDAPMGFAGLWESWRSPEGAALETFCILTTAANSFMATIHERMPVILSPSDYSNWLSTDQSMLENIARFFQPCSADSLTAVKVSTYVNSPGHSSEECVRQL